MSRRRSAANTAKRTNPELARFGLRWSRAEDRELRSRWVAGASIAGLARKLARPAKAIYWRAKHLGLPLGVPEGFEYLTHASERCGYTTSQLRMILRWARVRIHRALSRPDVKRRSKRAEYYVEPLDVDDAITAWHRTETLFAAATRHTLAASTIERLLLEHGVQKPKKSARNAHWRVESATVDEVVAAYRKRNAELLSIERHAKRHQIGRHTLALWLQAAGVAPANLGNRGCRLAADIVDRVVAEHRAKHPNRAKPQSGPIEIEGESMPLSAWCARFGISEKTVRSRMRVGATVEEALRLPPHPGRKAA